MTQPATSKTNVDLRVFEGLVRTTARMFAAQVGREEEDLAQELRVRVWRAAASYDPSKTTIGLKRYVYSAVANKVKDYKRDAARDARRRELTGVSIIHIEDMRLPFNDGHGSTQEAFESRHHFVLRETVYGRVEEAFVLPSTVTEREASVLVMLMSDATKAEVAASLGITPFAVEECRRSLRLKLADWKPSNPSQTVDDPETAGPGRTTTPAPRHSTAARV